MTVFIVLIILIFPIIFFKSGMVADDTSIQKKNLFGNTTEKYLYSEIKNIEVWVRYGIVYDITFDSGETISLCSHEFGNWFNNFGNSCNIMEFDKIISEHADKKIVGEKWRMESDNLRTFLTDEKTLKYFEKQFAD